MRWGQVLPEIKTLKEYILDPRDISVISCLPCRYEALCSVLDTSSHPATSSHAGNDSVAQLFGILGPKTVCNNILGTKNRHVDTTLVGITHNSKAKEIEKNYKRNT